MTRNNLITAKIGLSFITIILAIVIVPILLILLSQFSYAYNVSNVSIQDILQEDLSVKETIKIDIVNNNQNNFTFTAPDSAYALLVNNVPVYNNGSAISTPLSGNSCEVVISFHLDNVVSRVNFSEFDYSRNLGLPQAPDVLSYTVLLPPGYYLNPNHNLSMSPSIVPAPSNIGTNGRNIVISWVEKNPSLPKIYFVKYYNVGEIESLSETLGKELSEGTVLWIIFVVLIIGVVLGFFINKQFEKRSPRSVNNKNSRNNKVENRKISGNDSIHNKTVGEIRSTILKVPKSLLNPDEQTIIKLLQDNHNSMIQKDVGRKLEWSKSKVSAIMTNLEYKKIVEREKIGRNYKVELKKELDDY